MNREGLTLRVASTVLLVRSGLAEPPPEPDMIEIPTGEIWMGSEEGGSDEQPRHKVVFKDPFLKIRSAIILKRSNEMTHH
jgi:hypothetical protein